MEVKKGFTLVELLVVIAIIALLLSILMPALGKVREQGKKIVCASSLKTIGLANSTYAASYNSCYVPYWVIGQTYPNGGIYWCDNPEFRKTVAVEDIKSATGQDTTRAMPKKYKCPSDRKKPYNTAGEFVDMSYGFNYAGLLPKPAQPLKNGYIGYKEQQIKGPSQKLAFADGKTGGLWYLEADWKAGWDRFHDEVDGNITKMWYMTSYRHSEGTNILFYDGHVEWRRKGDVFHYLADNPARRDDAANFPLWIPLGDGQVFAAN